MTPHQNKSDNIQNKNMEFDYISIFKFAFPEWNGPIPALRSTFNNLNIEPMEYIAMDCDLKKCDSEVTYELISMIIYHGSDASHATALIKSDNKKEWYHYNDSYVSKEIDPISLLSPTFWPKVFLYQKI